MKIIKKIKEDEIVVELITPYLDKLNEFVEDFKNGKVEKAAVVYETDGKMFYRVLTDSPHNEIGWLLMQAAQYMLLEDMGL